ncbi:MAG: hypothetical protein ACOVS5_00505, partial [Oligoflexus sp.]
MYCKTFSVWLFILCSLGCMRIQPENGRVLVRAPNAGTFEIYRIESEEPLQFVSEQIGRFNEPLLLPPGQYLILADCSNETVVLRPGETRTLLAHQVLFNPPVAPEPEDSFSIQCNRFAKTKSRQHLLNRYSLNILHGTRDLLVGMVPLRVEFPEAAGASDPHILSYQLSGLRVEAYERMKPKTSFFVSPVEGLLSITENQVFGRWQFLLAGKYRIEVNGTRMEIELAEGQQQLIRPAFLRIGVSDAVNLHASSSILGTPLYVELNQGHWLDLNETYPVLPGEATLKLNGSLAEHRINLEEGLLTEKKVRSVLIDLDCSPWDWSCLGSREIFLYETDKPYPFAEGISDVPLLFFEEDAWVSIQGSRDLRYKIPDTVQDTNLKVGFVKLSPKQHHRPGQVTDLSRIEAPGFPLIGHSLDLSVDHDTLMPLIVGRYLLAQYQALATSDWERR